MDRYTGVDAHGQAAEDRGGPERETAEGAGGGEKHVRARDCLGAIGWVDGWIGFL